MNKNDIRLVLSLFIFVVLIFLFIYFNKEDGTIAEVYYEDDLILTIDLNIDNEYVVEGELGDVVIEVVNGMVRVKEENSPLHICSKEGFIGDSSRTLICLPNKIIIKITSNDLDGVVY